MLIVACSFALSFPAHEIVLLKMGKSLLMLMGGRVVFNVLLNDVENAILIPN